MDKNATKVLRGLFQRCKEEIDKNTNALPEDYRSLLTPVSEQFATTLAQLPAQADEGATDTSGAELMVPVLDRILASNKAFTEKITDLEKQLASLDAKVDDGVKAKLDGGEYVTKASLDEQVANVKKETETKFRTLASRKDAITEAGLPMPADFGLVEAASDDDFNKTLTSAKARVTQLGEKGITLNSAELKSKLLWATDAEYTGSVALMEEALAASKKQTNQARGGKTGEPLASGASQSQTAGKRTYV